MPALICRAFGPGDQDALPTLITRILQDQQQWNWYVGEAIVVRSLGKLHKNLAGYLSHAVTKKNSEAILIVLDLDDGCPKEEAMTLAERIRSLQLAQPVAIVFAYREYEAWLLASLPTIAGHYGLPSNLVYEGEVEERRNAKGWLNQRMESNKRYNPTAYQKKFTRLIDLDLAYDKSRSFRRLYHAIEELIEGAEKGERGYVTPQKE